MIEILDGATPQANALDPARCRPVFSRMRAKPREST
jgi:hypothetical protein